MRGVARRLASLERTQRVDERRLRDVLGVRVVAEHRVRVAIHVADVTTIEVVERGVIARLLDSVAAMDPLTMAETSGPCIPLTDSLQTSAQVPRPERIFRVMERRQRHRARRRRLLLVAVVGLLVVPAAHAAEPTATPILALRCHTALDRDGR